MPAATQITSPALKELLAGDAADVARCSFSRNLPATQRAATPATITAKPVPSTTPDAGVKVPVGRKRTGKCAETDIDARDNGDTHRHAKELRAKAEEYGADAPAKAEEADQADRLEAGGGIDGH